MLQVTADVFSGRPNPVWVVTDEAEARAALKEIVKDRGLVGEAASAEAGLGFRGVIVEPLADDVARDFGLPSRFYISAGPSAASRGTDIAGRLIGLMTQAAPGSAAGPAALPLDEPLQKFLLDQLGSASRVSVPDGEASPEAAAEAVSTGDGHCTIEVSPYNPGFWNNDPTTLQNNNCYNYASNKKTNTFAQPGRGSGHMYTAITCPAVTTAALSDGLHMRNNCFPASEAPRYLVAMVVAPGPGFIDYHWYRKMQEGFWGHKPGSTPVRNVDNSNKVIHDPATCNRGPYTQFCGYFYTCKSQKIN